MTHPTYDDVRAHKRSLLRLAAKNVVSPVPRRLERSIFRDNGLLALLRRRYVATPQRAAHAARPAAEGA